MSVLSLDRTPTHVVAKPGDKKAMCGQKKPLPVVWLPYVEAHVNGHGMVVCTGCQEVIDGALS